MLGERMSLKLRKALTESWHVILVFGLALAFLVAIVLNGDPQDESLIYQEDDDG